MKDKFYISTAIAYTSAKPHIGNTYEAILADCIASYKKLQGFDVYLQTGTDEHGQKIEEKAEAAGISPKEYVDKVAKEIQNIWDLMDVSYDKFVRTTDPVHEKKVQQIFKKLYDQGDIYKGKYEGLYCTPCESFWTESQLVDGKCPDCGREVHASYEEAYFFKMSKYADRLIEHIESHPTFIRPVSRKNEMMNNFLKPGLQDLCVSRTSFKWGIPVDFDDKHVVYVWLDALTNYITNIGFDIDGNHSDMFKKNWPADLHLIGKDIIRFHTIYWPIFLMALDLPLPEAVYGHPWLLQDKGKMSKSKGNVMYADDLASIFGVEALRYYVLKEMPFENDGSITYELMTEIINADLANTLGNLLNRTIAMSNKYFDGVVTNTGVKEDIDDVLHEAIISGIDKYVEKMDNYHAAEGLNEVINIFKRCNKYIDETTPWILAKDEANHDRLRMVLYNLCESLTIGATLLQPFMHKTAEKICAQLNTKMRDFDSLKNFGLYPSGNKVTDTPEILFNRLDLKEVMEKADAIAERLKKEAALESGETEEADDIQYEPIKETIVYDDFEKIDIRVGKVLSCERVKKSKKLLCSQVSIGSETRQILSGIYPTYTPEDMVGKEVLVLVNLAPRKMAGLESQGMILCSEDKDGNLSLVSPEKGCNAGGLIG